MLISTHPGKISDLPLFLRQTQFLSNSVQNIQGEIYNLVRSRFYNFSDKLDWKQSASWITAFYQIAFFLLFFLVAAVRKKDELQYINSRYFGGASYDAGLYVWLTEEAYKVFTRFNFHTSAFYPFGYSLAWSDNYILVSSLLRFFSSNNSPFYYNLCLLIVDALNGYCTFRVVQYLCGRSDAALYSGIAFQTFGFLSQHYGHPQLQWFFWIPLATEWYLRTISTRSILCMIGVISLVPISFATSVYHSIFMVLMLILVSLVYYKSSITSVASILYCARWSYFPIGIIFLALGLISYPYLLVQESFGSRNIGESFYFAANGLSYISASSLSYFYSNLSTLSHAEARLFPGFMFVIFTLISIVVTAVAHEESPSCLKFLHIFRSTLLLVLFSLVMVTSCFENRLIGIVTIAASWMLLIVAFVCCRLKDGQRQAESFFLFGFFTFLIISFGPVFSDVKMSPIPSLGTFVYSVVPGFKGIRAIGRAGLVAIWCASVLNGLILSRLFSRIVPIVLLTVIAFCENWHPIIPVEGLTKVPEMLNRVKENSVFISLPLVGNVDDSGGIKSWREFSGNNIEAMLWARAAGLRTVNGYSGQRTYFMERLPGVLRNFPDGRSFKYLSRIVNLKYVLFRSGLHDNFDRSSFSQRIKRYKRMYRLIEQDESGNYLFKLARSYVRFQNHIVRVPGYCNGTLKMLLDTESPTTFTLKYKRQGTRTESSNFKIAKRSIVSIYLKRSRIGVNPTEIDLAFNSKARFAGIRFECS